MSVVDIRPGFGARVRVAVAGLAVLAVVAALAMRIDPSATTVDASGSSWEAGTPVGPVLTEIAGPGYLGPDGAPLTAAAFVEVHNPTNETVNLAGYALGATIDGPEWQFPETDLLPDQHLVVSLGPADQMGADATGLHAPLELTEDHEFVALFAPDGITLADHLPLAVSPIDASAGRAADDLTIVCGFGVAAPGRWNPGECRTTDTARAPRLSHPSGFFGDPFDLTIIAPDEGPIYFTLDGTIPDPFRNPESTQVYSGPIAIDDLTGPPVLASIETTVTDPDIPYFARRDYPLLSSDDVIERGVVVRAQASDGPEATGSYYVGGRIRPELPVVSLTMDPAHLFDHDLGIYVPGRTFETYRSGPDFDPDARWSIPTNYNNRGRDWERPHPDDLENSVVFEYCSPEAGCDFRQHIGVRTHGGFSRLLPQKSLRLYARTDYGANSFDHQFFLDEPDLTGHRRLILRASGNDNRRLMFRDAYMQSLLRDLHADTQAYQPTALFINGEYWGIQNIRERFDVHYLELFHGADPDTVEFLNNSSGPLEGNSAAAERSWQNFLEQLGEARPGTQASHDLLGENIDLDTFLDYIIGHAFSGNTDWVHNNTRWWRQPEGTVADPRPPLDGTWRFTISDLDHMGGGIGNYNITFDPFAERLAYNDDSPFAQSGIPLVFHHVVEHPALRERFLERFEGLLNTDLHPDRTSAELDRVSGRLEEEIVRHTDRWGLRPVEEWHAEIEDLRAFMNERPDAMRDILASRFGRVISASSS